MASSGTNRENEIDAAVLPNLTAEDLNDLGIDAVGHRRFVEGYDTGSLKDGKALMSELMSLSNPQAHARWG